MLISLSKNDLLALTFSINQFFIEQKGQPLVLSDLRKQLGLIFGIDNFDSYFKAWPNPEKRSFRLTLPIYKGFNDSLLLFHFFEESGLPEEFSGTIPEISIKTKLVSAGLYVNGLEELNGFIDHKPVPKTHSDEYLMMVWDKLWSLYLKQGDATNKLGYIPVSEGQVDIEGGEVVERENDIGRNFATKWFRFGFDARIDYLAARYGIEEWTHDGVKKALAFKIPKKIFNQESIMVTKGATKAELDEVIDAFLDKYRSINNRTFMPENERVPFLQETLYLSQSFILFHPETTFS